MKTRLITDPVEINSLYDFIRSQNLDYPGYDEWSKKCRDEILSGYKKAFAIMIPDENNKSFVAGSIIVQTHKADNSVLELKNGRVRPEYEKRGYFKRIYLDVERYARENGYKKIVLDAHADNLEMITLMQQLGYVVECKENLYTSKSLEFVMAKDLSLTRIQALEAVVAESARKAILKIRLSVLRFFRIILVKDRISEGRPAKIPPATF